MTVNNKLFPCERIGHQFAMGKVSDNKVEINSKEIARKCNQYYDNLKNQCAVCYKASLCVRCMYTIKDLENRPICPDFCNKKEFERYVQMNINYMSRRPEIYHRIMKETIIID